MTKRGEALELAVLGLLQESPLHGYELRKRLTGLLGWGRVLSYGSLYPCLKQMLREGLIVEESPRSKETSGRGGRPETAPPTLVTRAGRRAKIVYTLSAEGKERFATLVCAAGPSAWEDDSFGVHFAFFASTNTETRIRILEGRRSRLEDRLDAVRTTLARSRQRVDAYALELQRHGLESVEREVRWLSELIDSERVGRAPRAGPFRPAKKANPNPGGADPSAANHQE
ncbi:MAG: PadR family transcriptional regulator [Nocardioidaceae bacterium]